MQELETLALKMETESMISASYVRDGEDEYHQGQCDAYQRAAEIVRELAVEYAGLVLCEKEPGAWMCPDDPERETAFSWKEGKCDAKGCGKQRLPLYAPASPLGNASLAGNGDIGKPVCKLCNGSGVNRTDPNAGNCKHCDIGKEGGE